MCLTFTAPVEAMGSVLRQEPLVPGGEAVDVTSQNAARFVALRAHHMLNKQIARQTKAFLLGFRQVVPLRYLRMFTPTELQRVLGGAEEGVSVEDLRAHVKYEGYGPESETVRSFWSVVEDMSPEDRSLLLRYVTSCSRPPLLGFRDLSPPFTVAKSHRPTTDLPPAHSCFNKLDLPEYGKDVDTLRAKLLLAIRSGAGFDLS